MKRWYLLILIAAGQFAQADVLHIEPYAQWTFDTPLEQVFYRSHANGFPIMYTLTESQISYYDSLGNKHFEIKRTPGDIFKMSEDRSHFMLVQQNESILAYSPQQLHSFQVYDFQGTPKYTLIQAVPLGGGDLNSVLTNLGNIILTQEDQSWIMERSNEDTLLFLENVLLADQDKGKIKFLTDQLINRNEFITAVSRTEEGTADSSAHIGLHLWNHDELLADPVQIPGQLKSLVSISETDNYFLEIFDGYESTLTLFDRERIVGHFPWKTWEIRGLDKKTAFVISENDFNVVNLTDATVISSFHPIDIATISDAAYLKEWGLFLYIRYESFYTDEGVQGYRKFELEGVSKTGQIAHRSSFGSWTTTLPKISQIEKDLFAIHMYNAVLLYRVELEKK